jgi:O-antigen ligase
LLSAFLALVFLTGGASRVDVQSLTVLRPVSVLLCGFALMSLRRDHIVGRGWLLGLFGCVAVLTLLHVIPLSVDPLSLRVIADEYGNTVQSAALQMSWGTLSVTPVKAWQSLATLATPGAVLLIAMQLKRSDLYRVLPLLVGLGALSGFIGLLQVVGNAESPFYLYRITNDYTAVGLFANRNHAALMLALLFPMLAVLASQDSGTVNDQNRRMLMAATIGIVLVPLILVTGSRSGLLVSLVGIGGAALLYQRRVRVSNLRSERVWKRSRAVPVLGALALVCLAFLTIFFSRAEAIERLFADESDMYGRGDFWVVSIDLFLRNLPWGSGAGSFAEMYQVAEPSRMLGSAFLNRAHNDWIETALTFGLPGLLIMTTGMVLYLLQTFRIWHKMDGKRQSVILARLSSIMIAMMALASVSDYPLRTPAMLCVLVVSLLWLIEPRKITV